MYFTTIKIRGPSCGYTFPGEDMTLPQLPCAKIKIGIHLHGHIYFSFTLTLGSSNSALCRCFLLDSWRQTYPRFHRLSLALPNISKYSRCLRMVRNSSGESWFYLLTSKDSYWRGPEYATPKYTSLAHWLFYIKGIWKIAIARTLWLSPPTLPRRR